MASAQSLMGLMSQLQSMENNFTCILMEAALKLASLADASIFLLVESAEGRRYAGRPHLCAAYQRGNLGALVNDVEMEADPNVSGLREKTQSFHDGSSGFAAGYHASSPSQPTYLTPSGRKRSSTVTGESSSSASKQPRTGGGSGGVDGGSAGSNSYYPPSTGVQSSSNSPFAPAPDGAASSSSSSVVPKHEMVEGVVKEEEESLYEVGEDDEDSDIEEIYAIESGGNDQSLTSPINESGHASSLLPHLQLARAGGGGGGASANNHRPAVNIQEMDQGELESAMKNWVQNFLRQNRKVGPLLEVTDPSCLVEKSTVERKLLSSLLYELAKTFATSNISSSINVSRKLAFDALWAFFSNFHPYEQHPCAFKEKRIPLKLMCSNIFSTAVSYSYHRMKSAAK